MINSSLTNSLRDIYVSPFILYSSKKAYLICAHALQVFIQITCSRDGSTSEVRLNTFPQKALLRACVRACERASLRAYDRLSFPYPSGPRLLQERTFSLCFSETGGSMVIGGYDPRLNKPGSQMHYTPSALETIAPRVKVTTLLCPFQGAVVCLIAVRRV